MSNTQAYDKALSVEVYEGEVVLRTQDGPMAISLTPRAAAETAEQLARAADLARAAGASSAQASSVQASQGSVSRE